MDRDGDVWRDLERDWRSPEEVATLLEIDPTTVYRWLRAGILDGLQIGKKWRISSQHMKEFLERQRRKQVEKRSLECPECGRRAECPHCGKDTYVY
jgi:excisionase family DNA binding protein